MTTGVILLILGLALMLEAAYGLLAPVLPFLLEFSLYGSVLDSSAPR